MLVYSVSKSSAARPSYVNRNASAMHGNKSPPPSSEGWAFLTHYINWITSQDYSFRKLIH